MPSGDDERTRTDTFNLDRVLLCLINPGVRKIRNEASSCPGIFSRLSAFTVSLAPPVHPSPIFLTDTENL